MAKKDDDLAKLIRHIRRMIWSNDGTAKGPRRRPDAFSILVRGIILIDEALEYVIDAYSAIGWDKVDKNVHRLTINEKAYIACALGSITQGELICVREINNLRNRFAHRIDVDVSPQQEEQLVKTFKSQTKLFQGLNYDPAGYPGTLVFLLLALTFSLRMRATRPGARIVHLQDKTNTEHIASITITTTMTEVMSRGIETDDDAVRRILSRLTDEALALRERDDLPGEART